MNNVFRTELKSELCNNRISHSSQLLTVGSCFAQVMGEKLKKNKFSVLYNPFGTIFNPVSIFRLLEAANKKSASVLDSYVENKGLYFNYHLHSDFYHETKTILENNIAQTVISVHEQLIKADYLLITMGTAYVYRLKETGEVVANCHKVHTEKFTKELLSVGDVVNAFEQFYKSFSGEKKLPNIVLTVSPVRHIKDTLPLNSVSKSVLRIACHELAQKYDFVHYFPAYEIMLDDLRDYRFYKEDMIHPTEVAENYIWDKFSEVYFSSDTRELIKEWTSLSRALEHKPLRADSREYKSFLTETLNKLELLKEKLNVSEEINFIKNKL